MANEFEIDLADYAKLIKRFKDGKQKFKVAVSRMLTSQAAGTRDESLRVMNNYFMVRNRRFIETRMRYTKAKYSMPINAQTAYMGVRPAPRFSALVEQELGKKTKRTRVATLLARRKSKAKQVSRPVRMKGGNIFPKPEDYNGKSLRHKNIVMLQALGRDGYRGPFVIHGWHKYASGLYKFGRGRRGKKKVNMLWAFDPEHRQPARIKFLAISRARYFAKNDQRRVWARIMRQIAI